MRLQDIALLISQEVKSDPAGDLSSGVARLKTGIDKKSIQSLASIPIISKEDGSKVYLQDLAILEINKVWMLLHFTEMEIVLFQFA